MCAKYGISRMNDAHTISPADLVGCPAKNRTVDHILFKKESIFCMIFTLAYGWPTCESAHG